MKLKLISIFFMLLTVCCAGQTGDTTQFVLDFEIYDFRWTSIGVTADPVRSGAGLFFSNGYDEAPLKHFEDVTAAVLYRLAGEFYSGGGYSVGAKTRLNNYRLRPFSRFTMEALQRNSPSGFRNQNVYLSTAVWIHAVEGFLFFKGGYQKMGTSSRGGFGLGFEKRFKRFYSGINYLSHIDYDVYAAFLQSFIWRDKLGLRVEYENLDRTDFLRLGLHLTISKQKSR